MAWLVATVAVTLPMVLVPVVGTVLWCWWDNRRHKRQCARRFEASMADIRRHWPLPGEEA